jgi:hypothetical protein
MKVRRRFLRAGLVGCLAAGCSGMVRGQSLVSEALSSFPADAIRIEYSHPAVLRSLPDYAALRQRYEGPRLQDLEESFSKLGIQENDVDELVLGWQATGQDWMSYGLTSGRFDAKTIAGRAAAQGIVPVALGAHTGYCVGAEEQANCVVLLGESLGAFGSQTSLRTILAVRDGGASSLGSSGSLAKWVGEAQTKSPIWGVATGPAVADWYKGWMPNQTDLKLDWSQAFKAVEVLTYSIDPGETVRLNVGMDCTTSADAASLRQVFDGLRLFQQIAWQNQNPGRPNPFKSLEIQANDRHVSVRLETSYDTLMAPGTPGKT